MHTHTLIAKTPEGRKIELGRVGSLERAVRLRAQLAAELGDEYTDFEIVEGAQIELPLEPPGPAAIAPMFVEVLPVRRTRSLSELASYLARIEAQVS